MFEAGMTVLFAMFLWWFSTGAILYLDRLPRSTFRWSMTGATVLLVAALFGLSASSSGAGGSYDAVLAFSCALIIWGWHEMSFLMGHVTGPCDFECPPGTRGFARFWLATQTVIYHEVAIVFTIAGVAYLSWGEPNQIGVQTLLLLWVMRLSTKFNLFLGVPRHHEGMLPTHLAFLQSYFRDRPMNWLFPLSVTGATVLTVILFQRAMAPGATEFEATGYALLATLSALGLVEHWFLVVPVPDERLWAWAIPKSGQGEPAPRAVELDRETKRPIALPG